MLIGVEIGLLALVALAYLRRTLTLSGSADAVPATRIFSFYAGLVVIGASATALDSLASELLYVHTIEHLLMADVGALLVVLGLTAPLLSPISKVAALRPLRFLLHPLPAVLLWGVDIALWHLRGPFESSLHHEPLHLLQHVLFVLLGVNVWLALIGPVRQGRPSGMKTKLACLLLWRAFGAALGAVSIWVPVVFYPYYMRGDTHHVISPLADQGIAGSIMIGEMALMTIGLLAWMYVRVGEDGMVVAETAVVATESSRA